MAQKILICLLLIGAALAAEKPAAKAVKPVATPASSAEKNSDLEAESSYGLGYATPYLYGSSAYYGSPALYGGGYGKLGLAGGYGGYGYGLGYGKLGYSGLGYSKLGYGTGLGYGYGKYPLYSAGYGRGLGYYGYSSPYYYGSDSYLGYPYHGGYYH